MVAVEAPAGYGKTIAVLLWAEADDRPFAWVQLTDADNDPVHLGRHIALALDALTPICDSDARVIFGVGRSASLDIFPLLARLMTETPTVLVLDDLHLLGGAEAIRGIEELARAASPVSQLVIIGRHLRVHLGRHRVAGTVELLTPADLAMDVTEADELFQHGGVSLEADQVALLVDRTEGWPAGLQLAALAIGKGQPYESFSGADRLLGEYLVEEVIDATDDEMVEFLERSATLEYFDAELLDTLLERSDSGGQLAAVESSGNLFLVPLDTAGRRYRYHHLFRDLLRRRLRTRRPELAQRLESRASSLFEAMGDVDGAIRHAVGAQDNERAADLVLRATMSRFLDGRLGQIRDWLALLGADAIDDHPSAAIATAWYAVGCADLDLVARACEAAEQSGWQGPLADGSPSVRVALAMVRTFIASEGTHGVARDAEIVREAGGPECNPWWAMATATQGSAYSMLGDLELARARFDEALASNSGPYLEAAVLAHLALLALYEDDLAEAESLATRARRIADEHNLESFAPALVVYAVAGLAAAMSRRTEEARRAIVIAREILERIGDASPRTALLGLLLLAKANRALSALDDARIALREARRVRRRDPSATFLNVQLDELAHQLDTPDDLSPVDPQALTAAELRVLDALPTHLSLRQIAGELMISRNTVKSHTAAIYRKLAVSSRSDAVTEARRLGLL